MNPLAPAILHVSSNGKTMMWPLTFAVPGQEMKVPPSPIVSSSSSSSSTTDAAAAVQIITVPSTVVAVGTFSNASVEPVVRKACGDLRAACQRNGLDLLEQGDELLQFCQYDAIFSMGKRRGEVWIPLSDPHPWTRAF
jgi:hypothetical protein